MAANWELQLISSIVRGEAPGDLFESAQKEGIEFRTFGGMEAKNLWASIDAHYRRPHNFGHVPSEQTLKESFPSLDFPKPVENFLDLCTKVRDGHLRRETESAVNKYLSGVEPGNGLPIVAKLHEQLGQILETNATDTDVIFSRVAFQESIDELRALKETAGMIGMPWPWARMNAATQGIQKGDYIMVWALPKSMKTWFGLVVAAHLMETGRRVLVYSKEMTWEKIRRRVASLMSKTDYTKLKENALSAEEETAYLDKLELITDPKHSSELVFTQADRHGGDPGGPDDIRRKIEVYRPHFVLLDSAYMLELPKAGSNALDWKQLSMVNRRLKQIAKTTGIPIMAILQENERSALKYSKSRGTASLAMNSGAVMDCDVGIRLIYNKNKEEISIHLAAARETKDHGFTINARASENFSYAHDELYTLEDVYNVEESLAQYPTTINEPTEQSGVNSPFMNISRERDEIDDDLGI
jgi:replicative DNA helicase